MITPLQIVDKRNAIGRMDLTDEELLAIEAARRTLFIGTGVGTALGGFIGLSSGRTKSRNNL